QCSIVTTFHKPIATTQLAINSIKHLGRIHSPARLEGNVPFISRPTIVAPPISGGSPWSSQGNNFSVDASLFTPGANLCRPTIVSLDQGSQRWTKNAKTQGFLLADYRLPLGRCLATLSGFRFCSKRKPF